MRYSTSLLLTPFYKKIHDLHTQYMVSWPCLQTNTQYCELCDIQFRGSLFEHRVSRAHTKCLNGIAEQLIDVFFSPGITLCDKTDCNLYETAGHCIFCDKYLFDFAQHLNMHLNDPDHQEKVKEYKMKCEALKLSAILETCCFNQDDDGNDILKKISCIGLKVADNGNLECKNHRFQITDENQFLTHITDPRHIGLVNYQLRIAADTMQLHRGITMKNNGFFCLICKRAYGNGLSGANEIWVHLSICCYIADIELLEEKFGSDTTSSIDLSSTEYCSSQSEREENLELDYPSLPGQDQHWEQSARGSSSSSSSLLEKNSSSPLEKDSYMEKTYKGSILSSKESSSPLADDEYTETSDKDPPSS